MKMGYSKISQDLFYILLDTYNIDDRNNIHFATHNGEFRLDRKGGGIWLYDFTDLKNKKIIEYNGDMYHANPKKYLPEDSPHPFRKDITSLDIWNKDKIKIETAKLKGYDVIVVWDSQFRWSRKKTINKCINFLKNDG